MNLEELQKHYETAKDFIVYQKGTAKDAMIALAAIKDFAKQHIAKPEQATLLDAPETKRRPGGY